MTTTISLDYRYDPKVRYAQRTPHAGLDRLLEAGCDIYAEELRGLAAHLPLLDALPLRGAGEGPCWINGWLPGLDSLSIYGLLARLNPPTYLEVGSGYSTMFARRAVRDHGLRTRIVSIDPAPRAQIDALCDTVIRAPLEDVDPSVWRGLEPGGVFFLDSSHRSFQNSDVTVFFLEVLPELAEGVTVGLHDILLPYDYPQDWIAEGRFYNEQYLLAAFLLGGHNGYELRLPSRYVYENRERIAGAAELAEAFAARGVDPWGGAFWMRRSRAA